MSKAVAPWVAGILAAVLAIAGSWNASPTDDEPTYVGQGAYLLTSGDFDAPVLLWQPPLALYLSAAGAPFVDYPEGALDHRPAADSLTGLGDRLIFESPSSPRSVLRASRLPVALVTGLLAALAAALAGALGGGRSAWIAGLLTALQPVVFGHGGLATTDVVATATALAAVAAVVWPSEGGLSPKRIAVAGALLGLALLSKHTSLAILPVCLAGVYLDGRARQRTRGSAVGAGAAMLVVACTVVWAGYGFTVGTLVPEGSSGDLAAKVVPVVPLPESWVRWFAGSAPVPAPKFLQSLAFQMSKQHDRLFFRFFGEVSKTGWWSYFPVVTAGKLTLGSLAVLLTAAVATVRRRPTRAEALLFAAFALPFLAAVVSRHNLGVRHVLPALPPLFVLAAVRFAGRDGAPPNRKLGWLLVLLLGVHVTEGLSATRNPVAWWNPAAGGTTGGWRIAEKTNGDWGQGLWGLRDLAREEDLDPLYVFAHGPAAARAHIDEPRIHFLDSWKDPAIPDSGWLAVSTSAPWRNGRPPHTDAPPDRYVAGCYRLYRLPLPE